MTPEIRLASVPGREHTRLFRNNQDGAAARIDGDITCAVVTDGCSSGSSSEVGARLGARFLAQVLPGLAREHGLTPKLAERACDALVAWLYGVARGIDPELTSAVADQLLFTVLATVTQNGRAIVFGVGDGVWSVDGTTCSIDPGPENAPEYVGYRLVPAALMPRALRAVEIHYLGCASRIALGTDGVGDWLRADAAALDSVWSDPSVWKNPVHLERRVRVAALHDDTTLVLLKVS